MRVERENGRRRAEREGDDCRRSRTFAAGVDEPLGLGLAQRKCVHPALVIQSDIETVVLKEPKSGHKIVDTRAMNTEVRTRRVPKKRREEKKKRGKKKGKSVHSNTRHGQTVNSR